MNKPTVYLAGPIRGLSYQEAILWRTHAAAQFQLNDIAVLDPMRGKGHLVGEQALSGSYEDTLLCSQRGIVTRDRFDLKRSDLMLVNFVNATEVSLGTCVEFGWASAYDKPIVLAMPPGCDCGTQCSYPATVHEHPFIDELASLRTETLDEAIEVAIGILRG